MHPSFQANENYIDIQLIAHGEIGEVFSAKRKQDGLAVAIKRFHPHLRYDNPKKNKFFSEIDFLKIIQHPCIVTFFELVETNDELFSILEWIEGPTLEKIQQEKLSENEVKNIIMSLKKIIDDLQQYSHPHHSNFFGIIHGDLQPKNIIISKNGPKLIDFSSAQWMQPNISSYPFLGAPPRYQLKQQKIDHTMDRHHDYKILALLFYELLKGEPAIKGQNTLDIFIESYHFDFASCLQQLTCSQESKQLCQALFYQTND